MDFNKIKEMGLEYAEKGKNAAMDLAEYYECVAAKELFVKHLKELQNKK